MTRVLVVDDDRLFGALLCDALVAAKYTAQHVSHALEAIEAIESSPPAAIVLDVMLPAAGGLALLHELQSYSDTARIPVLLCSSLAEHLDAQELIQYGVVSVLDKATMYPHDVVAALRRAGVGYE